MGCNELSCLSEAYQSFLDFLDLIILTPADQYLEDVLQLGLSDVSSRQNQVLDF